MESKTSSNVIDLAARAMPAHPAALAEVRLLSTRRLPAVVAEVLDRADDALFDFVQRTKSNTEQQDYFDAMRELRRQRAQVEQRYRDRLANVYAALEKRQPIPASNEKPADESQGLSLIGSDELEEQLACDQLVAQADRRHRDSLRQLERRLAVAAGLTELPADHNPIGPHHICNAFRESLGGVEASIKARLVLYKLFERELLDSLGGLLHDANQRLHQLGIMPSVAPAKAPPNRRLERDSEREDSTRDDGIERQVIHDRDDRGESGYVPRTGGKRERERSYSAVSGSGAQHPVESVDSIFSSVRELCEAVLAAKRSAQKDGPEGGQPSAPRTYLPEQHALSALRSLQNELPTALLNSIDDPQLSLSTLLKQELLNQAERLKLSEPGAELAAQDEQALFLVGMLFDVLLSQRSYERPVRRQFARLTVPYARAALLDQHLFALKTHPARQLLNSLAEACDGNRGESAAERDLLDRVGNVVDRLISEFNEDVAIFSELETDFRSFLDQHRKRAELAERRAAEAQRGKERLDEARAMAAMELASVMGAREAPPVVELFLARYWTHHLAVTFLREGGESARYVEARRSGEIFFQAFLGCETGADLPEGLSELGAPILSSSGITGPAAKEVLEAVEWVLHALRLGKVEAARKHPLPSAMRDALEAERRVGDDGLAAVGPLVAASTALAEPQATAAPSVSGEAEGNAAPELKVVASGPAEDEYDAADIEHIQSLQVGAWVEFVGEDGSSIPTKLSWVSPISSRLLFVTRRGMRHCAASPQELAVMIKQDKLHLRVGDSAFEQAMNQVLGRLREAVPAQRVG